MKLQKKEAKIYFNLIKVLSFYFLYEPYVTLHRILMLKVKARARHAFTLRQKNLF